MWTTPTHVVHMQYREGMSKMIQIRNVPEDVHRELKVRASRAGMSLSDFLNTELVRVVARQAQLVGAVRRLRATNQSQSCGYHSAQDQKLYVSHVASRSG